MYATRKLIEPEKTLGVTSALPQESFDAPATSGSRQRMGPEIKFPSSREFNP